MTREEADDAIEAKLERVGNARNLANPDILRAMLAGIGLVIVPREFDTSDFTFAEAEAIRSFIDTALGKADA